MKSLILMLAFACSVHAGNITVSGPFSGLNNTDHSITIAEGEAQDTLNVEVSKDSLSLRKRKGYTSLANLTTSTMPITGSVSFKTSAGDNIKLFAQDSYVSKSVNGGAFTNLITSATVGAKYSFCVSDGKVYTFNDQHDMPWSYDGSAVTYYPSMPRASLCAMTVDRMLLAGTTDFPNRLYFSQSGGITNFTVDINPEDPGFESVGLPGEKITAIFATQTEWLVFKTNAFITYQGSNQFDLVRSVISERVGMIDPHAIVQNEGIVYFKSSDGRFYGYTSGQITEISKKIEGIVTGITRDETTTGEYTTKTQFDTGIFYNTTSSATAGSIEPLDYGFIDTTDADFNKSDVSGTSTTIANNSVYLNLMPDGTYPNSGGEYPGTGTAYFYNSGSFQNIGTGAIWGTRRFSAPRAALSCFVGISYTGVQGCYPGANTRTVSASASIDLSTLNTDTVGVCYYVSNGAPGGNYAYMYSIYPFKKTNSFQVNIQSDANYCYFDVPEPSPWVSSGTYTSSIIKINNASDNYKYVVFSDSAPAVGYTSINHYIHSSTATDGIFTEWEYTTNYYLLSDTTNQYWQYKVDFINQGSYLPPYLESAQLVSKTTGYWETPEYNMGGMTSWGLFNANSTLDSAASLTYKIAVSTYAGGTANAILESLTPGALITASTGTYSKIRATNNFTTATETVRMDGLSYSWSRSPDKMANAFEYKGDVYFGVPYNNSLSNNRVLKFDTSSGGWNIFDIPMNSPLSIDEYVYFGSPTGGYTYKYPMGDNDNGAAYNSYWKSKNYIGTNPYVEKQFEKMSLIAGSDYGSSLDVTYTMDTSTSTTYSISLTSSTADFVRNNRQLPIGEIGAFFNLQFGNNGANNPWTFYGASVDYTDDPWRVIGD